MTVRDLINGSLRLLGVLAEGEAATAPQMQDALSSLNAMLDSWSTESLSVMGNLQYIVTLSAAQQSYTMGLGGDINIPRPTQISDVSSVYPNAAQDVFLPMDEYSQAEYSSIAVIGYQTPIPLGYFLNTGFPLNEMYIYPVPQAGTMLRFWASGTINQFTDINQAFTFAPGYERAVRYALALEVAPEYGAASVAAAQLIEATARTAKENVQRLNAADLTLTCDVAMNWRGGWNRLTGDYR